MTLFCFRNNIFADDKITLIEDGDEGVASICSHLPPTTVQDVSPSQVRYSSESSTIHPGVPRGYTQSVLPSRHVLVQRKHRRKVIMYIFSVHGQKAIPPVLTRILYVGSDLFLHQNCVILKVGRDYVLTAHGLAFIFCC